MEYYNSAKKPTAFAQNNLFFVDALGVINDKHFVIDREVFRNNLIIYIEEGTFHVEQNGHYVMHSGEFIIMHLTEKHKYYSDPINHSTIIWMHFGTNHLSHLLNTIEKNHQLPYIDNGDWVREHLLTCVRAAKDNSPNREFIYSEKIYQILLKVNYEINCTESSELKPNNSFIRSVNDYLEANLYEKPDLCAFAYHCGYSPCYFIKKFKEHFGVSPIRYSYNMKLDYSKRMLTYSNEAICHIAMSLGFNTQNHFSKAFKDYVGLSPRMYKKID